MFAGYTLRNPLKGPESAAFPSIQILLRPLESPGESWAPNRTSRSNEPSSASIKAATVCRNCGRTVTTPVQYPVSSWVRVATYTGLITAPSRYLQSFSGQTNAGSGTTTGLLVKVVAFAGTAVKPKPAEMELQGSSG